MAEVNARKRGSYWEYRFEAAKIEGKRNQISKSGFRTKKEALEAGSKALTEFNNAGFHFIPSEISFSDYLDFWMEQYCKVNLAKSTCENYEKKIRLHIKVKLGKYKLRALTPAVLQTFLNDKFNEGYSRNTLSVIKGILTGSFNYAVEPLRFIQISPMHSVKLPLPRAQAKVKTRKKERRALSAKEWNAIINRFPEGHSSHIPLQLAYRCGLRLGETFALTWDDIDFKNKCIDINKQVQMDEDVKLWTFYNPKYDSFRVVETDNTLLKLLSREKEKQLRARMCYGQHYINQHVNDQRQLNTNNNGEEIRMVCIREDGSYIQPRTTQHIGRVVHYKLDIEDYDFHSLRHTHSTMLLEQGVNPKYVQVRLGHKNIETTLNIYADCTKKMQTDAMDIIEKIL